MKQSPIVQPDESNTLSREILQCVFLLSLSSVGGWLTIQSSQFHGTAEIPWRLLMVLLVQPFAIAAWVFCGLPGVALAVTSLFHAIQQRRAVLGMVSVGLLALGFACASLRP